MDKTLAAYMEDRNNKLINAVIRRIERDCPGAVAMIGIGGSFCNGDFHERSDLDLMIVIDDEAAWKIAECFVIGEIGFDIYCTPWERLEEDAECGTPHLSKVMDAKIIYCPKEESMARYMALREKAKAILSAPFSAADLQRAEKEYEQAELQFSKLTRAGSSVFDCRYYAVVLLYHLEDALCILNKSYYKMGVKRIFEEFAAMPNVPENFEDLARALCEAEEPDGMREAACALFMAVDQCFRRAKANLPKEEKPKPSPENISGTLEEMISNYRGKMWKAIERNDTHAAFAALGSLQVFFDELHDSLDMPRYDALSGFDPKDLHRSAENYEAAIRAYQAEYEKAGVKLNAFDTVEAFTEHYLAE
ncbi:MAG: hypothetical protein J6I98_04775 [Clostridia bacterium]|nr:hypothetical protein [Clostridia bacterium]